MDDATCQRILDNYACGLLVLDVASGAIARYNRRAVALLGCGEDLVGRSLWQLASARHQPELRACCAAMTNGHSPKALNFDSSGGSRLALDFDFQPGAAAALCFLRAAADVCAVQDELAQSEWRFRTLFDAMVEGVALHRLLYTPEGAAFDYVVLQVNPAFERHTGLAAAAVEGRSALAIYGDQIPYLDVYARVAETCAAESFEDYFAPLDRYFRVTVFSPARGYFATVFEDISERKRLEAATFEAEFKYRRLYAGKGGTVR